MMRSSLIVLLFLACSAAFAQAPKTAKPEAAVKPEAAAKPAPEKVAGAKHSRRKEDARRCLDEPSNSAIIKCAEAYL